MFKPFHPALWISPMQETLIPRVVATGFEQCGHLTAVIVTISSGSMSGANGDFREFVWSAPRPMS